MPEPDFDINDDGYDDVVGLPTKPCWAEGRTNIPEHGYHTFTNFEIPPRVHLCRGYPWPVEKERQNVRD